MEFSRPILEVIRQRVSHRTFIREPIQAEVLEKLIGALQSPPVPPFKTPIRLAVLEAFDPERQGIKKLGTYGVIRGAQNFIAGATTTGGRALEDFGYLLEWAILMATDLGLQTCWLGGTLKRDAFGRALQAAEGQVVPAVAALGYAKNRRGLLDATMRLAVGSKNRRAWSSLFFSGDFIKPLTEEAAGSLAPVIEAVRLAPSASNKQPWRLMTEAEGKKVHFFLRSNPGYQRVFAVDLQHIDLGIAMCHFDLATRHLRMTGSWEYAPPEVGRLPPRTGYIASWIAG